MKRYLNAIAIASALASSAVLASPCASRADAALVRDYYAKVRPGAPPAIPGRVLRLRESEVVSGLADDQAHGMKATPALFRSIWQSIDAWGPQTRVGLVVTMGGQHAWNFPSLVPTTMPDRANGMYDMYADKGAGVHGHITMDEIGSIWMINLPGKEGRTRAVNFYNHDGSLALGVYASIAGDPFDDKAVQGFAATWKAFAGTARACR